MQRWSVPQRKRSSESGQTIYIVLLILAVIALTAGIFFPTFEYFTLYHGKDFPREPRSLVTEEDKSIPADDSAARATGAVDKGGE